LKKGVKNPKNFGKNEFCFSWLFRFGARNFSLEKFLRFDGAKTGTALPFLAPYKPLSRFFPFAEKNCPKTALFGESGK